MNFAELRKAMDAAMTGGLIEAGLRRIKAGTWNRCSGEELNVIQFQKHSSGKSFCVNLGIHYAFLPTVGAETPADREKIAIADCELRFRLTDQAAVNDQWWPIAPSSVAPVAELVRDRGLPSFASYRLDGAIMTMEGAEVENGNPGLLASMTKGRACLLLARMHQHLGNREKCVEAAEIGLKLVGPMAAGPRKAFKNILGL